MHKDNNTYLYIYQIFRIDPVKYVDIKTEARLVKQAW